MLFLAFYNSFSELMKSPDLKLVKLLLLVANAVICVISFSYAMAGAGPLAIGVFVITCANTVVIATSKHYL